MCPSGPTCISGWAAPGHNCAISEVGGGSQSHGLGLVPMSASPRGCTGRVVVMSGSLHDSSGLGAARMKDAPPTAPARSRRAEKTAPTAPCSADRETEALTTPTALRAGAEMTSRVLTSESVFAPCWAARGRREYTTTWLCVARSLQTPRSRGVQGRDTHPQNRAFHTSPTIHVSHVL